MFKENVSAIQWNQQTVGPYNMALQYDHHYKNKNQTHKN